MFFPHVRFSWFYRIPRSCAMNEERAKAYNPSPDIRETAGRLNVASWGAVPDEATSSSSGNHPNVGP